MSDNPEEHAENVRSNITETFRGANHFMTNEFILIFYTIILSDHHRVINETREEDEERFKTRLTPTQLSRLAFTISVFFMLSPEVPSNFTRGDWWNQILSKKTRVVDKNEAERKSFKGEVQDVNFLINCHILRDDEREDFP